MPQLSMEQQKKHFPDEEINDDVKQRLSEVYPFFSKYRNSDRGIWKVFNYYDENLNMVSFIDDLMKYPILNTEMISHIIWNYKDSSLMRQILLMDLFKLVIQKKYEPALRFLTIFGAAKRTSLSVSTMVGFIESQQDKMLDRELQSLLCNAIVRQALQSGETTLAVSFIFQMGELNLKVSKTMVNLVCQTLCIPNKTQEAYNAFFLLKLVLKFPLFKYLRYLEAMKVLDYLSSKTNLNAHAYLFYNKVIQRYTKLREVHRIESYFGGLFNLILQNIQVLNIKRANGIWLSWKDLLLAQEDRTIDFNCIIRLIEANEDDIENQRKIIESLPTKLIESNEVLFDFFIKYYGTHYTAYGKEFDGYVRDLKPPLRRLTISLLFLGFLSQNNEVGSERLLQLILKSPNGLNKFEFEAIIKKLLTQGSIEQCIKMCHRTDIQVSLLGYIRILHHLMLFESDSSLTEKLIPIVISKFNLIHQGDSLLLALTETIFNYISDKVSNRASRSLFIRLFKSSQDKQMSRVSGGFITLEKYGLPNELVRLLDVEHDTVRILRVILDFSIVEEDMITLRWAIDQMRFQNVSTRDIIAYIMKTNDKFAARVFEESLIASCK
ncbi:uncharacterized protein KQ657_000160 [Scheffersomyces spartinae]|uniref:Uncharacterized protein n=1 Tax=Scheffersomyces spartinae TaxID=45513 RepID=A0A9P7VEV1_9ASCO|nr:uncharacterized protein KQ657_000160 [Scheffersomyces spartinae]KAG7196148.1 hypothetical protein KQ657_000160 [Scheffersomyces spartinae]